MKIITGRAAERWRFQMPTDEQLRQLDAIVVRAYPKLGLPPDAIGEEVEQRARAFRNAFLAIGYLGRRDEPETKNAHSLAWWLGHIKDWLNESELPADLTQSSFVAACVAHGDVPFFPLDRYPYDTSLGLMIGYAGRRATDAWRKVLTSGQPPAPVKPVKMILEPSEVVQMNLMHGAGGGVG